jgi:hypothetical protein
LTDFAAQVHSTLHGRDDERASLDSLETADRCASEQIVSGPGVRSVPFVNGRTGTGDRAANTSAEHLQQEHLRRSYHESFFDKNTPVTSDEQVSAWLGVQHTSTGTNKAGQSKEKAVASLDGHQSKSRVNHKSILKRSPSVENTSTTSKRVDTRTTRPQPVAHQRRVKDSLDVINAQLQKAFDIQVVVARCSCPVSTNNIDMSRVVDRSRRKRFDLLPMLRTNDAHRTRDSFNKRRTSVRLSEANDNATTTNGTI